jgi:inosine triphosphate pyrophosphatase
MLDGFPTRAAWALCTFAYSAGPGTEPILFEGRTDGKIVPARGPPKFGWDPVFEAEDTGLTYVSSFGTVKVPADRPTSLADGKTWAVIPSFMFFVVFCFLYSYAEMESKQKNAISHRGRALEKLRAYLQQALDVASASVSA